MKQKNENSKEELESWKESIKDISSDILTLVEQDEFRVLSIIDNEKEILIKFKLKHTDRLEINYTLKKDI